MSAVVLAAGRSMRMGEAKQLLRLGGCSMLQRTLENVRASGVEEVVLVLGFAAEAIQRELSGPLLDDVRVVVNENYESGMSSSLRVGLAAVSPVVDAALIMLADQPFVRPETMRRIVEHSSGCDAEIVVPMYKGERGNPVLLGRPVFAEAMRLEGDVGFRAIFANHADEIARIEVDDPAILMDIDTREDYERMRGGLPD
ncbi:MAG: nucleotidyltransferase family protein [Acidobacteriaceae bacterium]